MKSEVTNVRTTVRVESICARRRRGGAFTGANVVVMVVHGHVIIIVIFFWPNSQSSHVRIVSSYHDNFQIISLNSQLFSSMMMTRRLTKPQHVRIFIIYLCNESEQRTVDSISLIFFFALMLMVMSKHDETSEAAGNSHRSFQ